MKQSTIAASIFALAVAGVVLSNLHKPYAAAADTEGIQAVCFTFLLWLLYLLFPRIAGHVDAHIKRK